MKIKFENENERKALVDVLASNLRCPKQYGNLFTGYRCVNHACTNCWSRLLENISEVKETESSLNSNEKNPIINKEDLYDAVCKEVTLYEERNSLSDRAENLKKDIYVDIEEPYKSLLHCVKYHTVSVLKEFHNNWNALNWMDYTDEEHIEYLRGEVSELLVDSKKDMHQAENMKTVLRDVANTADGIYGTLINYVLEECESEQDYYELLTFMQNHWEIISWKCIYSELFREVEELIQEYKEDENKLYPSQSIRDMCTIDLQNRMTNALFHIAKMLVPNECEKIKNDLKKISQIPNKPIRNLYSLLLYYRDHWSQLEWHDLKSAESKVKEEPITMEEPEEKIIRSFMGKYAFLSNAYEEEFVHHGISYRNAEAAYQASKVEYDTIKNLFSKLNAHDAKKLGKQLTIRDKWDSKVEMYEVIWDKFYQSPKLRVMLMETKDAVLTPEGIGTFWGMKDDNGENHLGKILMDVRDNLFAIESEKDSFDKEVDEAIRTEKESMEKASAPKHQTPIYDFFKAISDYEKGVVNVEHMTNAITNLAKNLIDNERALLIADLSELLEESENVPKALYALMKKYKEKELHFKD